MIHDRRMEFPFINLAQILGEWDTIVPGKKGSLKFLSFEYICGIIPSRALYISPSASLRYEPS
jgi:hypothetical protein